MRKKSFLCTGVTERKFGCLIFKTFFKLSEEVENDSSELDEFAFETESTL